MRAVALALTALLSVLLLSPEPANAAHDPERLLLELEDVPKTERTVQLLGQLMVSEGGWDSAADHSAVAWTITARFSSLRAAGRRIRTLDDAILAYADVLDGPTSGRPLWVSQLSKDCSRPDALPSNVRWEQPRLLGGGETAPARAERCAEVFERAESFLAGALDLPCDVVPDHWGGPVDDRRAARAVSRGAWREVSCEGTANRFFEIVPRAERRPVRGPVRIGGRIIRFTEAHLPLDLSGGMAYARARGRARVVSLRGTDLKI